MATLARGPGIRSVRPGLRFIEQANMDFIKHRILWIPLIFAVSFFAVDKIFFLTSVRRTTEHWSRLEDYFYGSRERLFDMLKSENADSENTDDIILIYGSSRSAPFPVAEFADEFPGSLLYNFSAPSAAPSYYYYWHSRIRREVAPHPRLALIEIDAGLFTYEALQPSLAHSYDPEFVVAHMDWGNTGRGFSVRNAETFFSRRLFALLKYPLVVEHIIENQRELRFMHEGRPVVTTQLALKDKLFAMMAESFEALRGGIPYPVPRTYRPEELEAHAAQAARRYRGDAATRESQSYFLRLLLEDLARDRTPVLIYWPIVADPLRKHLRLAGGDGGSRGEILTGNLQAEIRELLSSLENKYPGSRMRLIDLNGSPELECREFSDSYHLAGVCFPELTRDLLAGFRRP